MNFIHSYSGSKRAITLLCLCSALLSVLPAQEYIPRSAFRFFSNEMLGDHSFAFDQDEYDAEDDSFADMAEDGSSDDTSDDSESGFGNSAARQDAWLSAPSVVLDDEQPVAKSQSSKSQKGTETQQLNQQETAKGQQQTSQQKPSAEAQQKAQLPEENLQTQRSQENQANQTTAPASQQQNAQTVASEAQQISPPQTGLADDSTVQQAGAEQEQSAQGGKTGKNSRTAAAASALQPARYLFRYLHTVHKGAQFSAGVSGLGYTGYVQLTSSMPMPYFELSAYKFGIGLYPLTALQSVYPEKNIPTLFLGAGSLTFGSLLKVARFPGYSALKTGYAGVKMPRQRFITVGTGPKAVQYGVELSSSNWNAAFFASPEPQRQRMRYGLLGGWSLEPQQTDIKLSVRALTAFVPEVVREVQAASPSKKSTASEAKKNTASSSQIIAAPDELKQRYHTLAGLQLVFAHPNISFEADGFFTYAANGTASGSVQAECDLWYRVAGLRTGASYTGAQSINWDGKQQQSLLTGFLQPYARFGIFSISALYGFNKNQKDFLHTGGAAFQLKHKIVRSQIGWDYRKQVHTLTAEVLCVSDPAWFTGVQWFQKAGVSTAFELQDAALNPLVLKKYRVSAKADFCITEGMLIGCSGTVSQAVRKTGSGTKRMIYLQSPVYGGAAFFSIKREGIGKVHTGKLEVSVKNEKPYFDVKIGYQIQGK